MSAHDFPGVEYDAGTGGDSYLGKADALIAAGLLTADQIPEGSAATFVDGVRQPRGQKPKHDERWMHVYRYGTSFRVTKGISAEEQQRRREARQAEIEEYERTKPKTDIGIEAAAKAMSGASTLFNVGDRVMCGKQPVIVTGGYKLRRVTNPDGEFLDKENGKRVDYQRGYTCQYRNGEEYFFEACQLTDDDGCPTHLRLVSGARKQEERAELAFKVR